MSIWVSMDDIGQDEDDNFDGSVVSYISGWSNHYPGDFPQGRDDLPDLTEETPAGVDTAWLPPYCVPGQRHLADEWVDIDEAVGPWLRLGVTMRRVSVWGEEPEVGPQEHHAVCLNEDAVRKLRDELSEWLDREKVYPTAVLGVSQ